MFGKLLPRNVSFFEFFEEHASLIVKAAHLFLLHISSDANASDQIKTIEEQADDIVHRCAEALHKTFITPIERDDIHRLLSRMDDILDEIEAAVSCLIIYKIKTITPELKIQAEILYKAALEIENGIKCLRDMKNADVIRQNCRNINFYENQADKILIEAIGQLFEKEEDTRMLIKWKEIYEILENAIDRCEDVADIIEDIILEYS